jgi:hypothetical protein
MKLRELIDKMNKLSTKEQLLLKEDFAHFHRVSLYS